MNHFMLYKWLLLDTQDAIRIETLLFFRCFHLNDFVRTNRIRSVLEACSLIFPRIFLQQIVSANGKPFE